MQETIPKTSKSRTGKAGIDKNEWAKARYHKNMKDPMHELTEYFVDHRLHSESLETGILLSLSGGIVDVITYMERGHVFATAQAGNLVFLGISITELDFAKSIQYLIPVLFFIAGVMITTILQDRKYEKIHWRQIPLTIEILLLIGTIFVGPDMNYLACILANMAAGIQLTCFKTINGLKIPTTMVAGDLRNGSTDLMQYARNHEQSKWTSGWLNLIIAGIFLIGAIAGDWVHDWFGVKTMWLAILPLVIVLIRITKDKGKV